MPAPGALTKLQNCTLHVFTLTFAHPFQEVLRHSRLPTDAEGKLKPYEVVLENMKNFAIRSMGVSEAEALKMAQEGMAKQPAWQNEQA